MSDALHGILQGLLYKPGLIMLGIALGLCCLGWAWDAYEWYKHGINSRRVSLSDRKKLSKVLNTVQNWRNKP